MEPCLKICWTHIKQTIEMFNKNFSFILGLSNPMAERDAQVGRGVDVPAPGRRRHVPALCGQPPHIVHGTAARRRTRPGGLAWHSVGRHPWLAERAPAFKDR